jgi:integrase
MGLPDFTALARLRAEQSRLTDLLHAPNTRRGYHFDWQAFTRWCSGMERPALPASADTAGLYVADELTRGRKVSTVARRVAAIAHQHRARDLESPVTPEVRRLLLGARRDRTRGETLRQALPITIADLCAMSTLLLASGSDMGARDAAVLVVGFASALRSANLASLQLSDVVFSKEGVTLTIHFEKMDQVGQGRLIGLPHGKHSETCPVLRLRGWIARRGLAPGPLFTRFDRPCKHVALQPERIGQIVKVAARRAGLEGEYSAHSLRAGFITEAAYRGVPDLLIAGQSGHKSMTVLRGYFRRRDVFRANACALLDL